MKVTDDEYFQHLSETSQLHRAQEKARVNWRETLEEAKVERPQDEGNHPYVRIMPNTNRIPQKKKEEKMQEIEVQESKSFEELFGQLVESDWRPEELRISQEAKKEKKPAAKPVSRKPDTRSDAEKMADAVASPRKGALGGTRAD